MVEKRSLTWEAVDCFVVRATVFLFISSVFHFVFFASISTYCSMCWKARIPQIQIRAFYSNALHQKLDLIELLFYYCERNPLTSASTYLAGSKTTFFKLLCAFLLQVSCSNSPTVTPSSGSHSSLSPIGPIGRPKCFTNGSLCSESSTSSVSSPTSNYPKAPGFEREDQVHTTVFSSPF